LPTFDGAVYWGSSVALRKAVVNLSMRRITEEMLGDFFLTEKKFLVLLHDDSRFVYGVING
jgi:hypothetical protein